MINQLNLIGNIDAVLVTTLKYDLLVEYSF